jgi:NAD(P)-dependent dehydrogenase (short-subunit alcohol dehydrogenase family)
MNYVNEDVLSLTGKTALISGAAGNIGAGTARMFARHGADLVLTDRSGDTLERVADEIREESKRTVVTVIADIGSNAEVQRVAKTALDAFGRIDILMNNAAGAMDPEPHLLLDTDDKLWDEGIQVNMMAPFRLVKALAPSMMNRGGSIINVLSSGGFMTFPGRIVYGSTKAALWTMTRYMAKELAPNVRVNAVCPGTVPRGEGQNAPEWDEFFRSGRVPLGRAGTNSEVARAALFLASDASSFTTAQVIYVDGGRVSVG